MKRWGLFFATLLTCGACLGGVTGSAWAQPAPLAAATASGRFVDEHGALAVSQVTALALDNIDGQGDADVKLRVVLSDRPVPPEALMGGSFPPIWPMARAGQVSGVMLEFDPADRTKARLTILRKPADPAESLETISLSDSTGLWRALSRTPTRVSGRFVGDGGKIDLIFDATVATNAVVADLEGSAARSSEFVSTMRQCVRAYTEDDKATLARLSSRERLSRVAADDVPLAQRKAFAAALTPLFDKVQRVVVREHTAVILMPDGFSSSFVKEDDAWKCAN
jgi:hypothetical protein